MSPVRATTPLPGGAGPGRSIDVLVADDSPVARMVLVHLLESDPHIRVIGCVADGQAALDFVLATKPHVVVMDVYMPRMDGFEATRRIMQSCPVPIIICSGTLDRDEVALSFRVLEAGAVACLEKPMHREHPDYEASVAHLLQTVRLMSEVRVVRRWVRGERTPPSVPAVSAVHESQAPQAIRVVGIGASTGGPPVLQTILCGIARDFPVPILVVQHIAQGFLPGLAEWLQQTTGLRVHIGAHGIHLKPGHVYLAPDDFHMTACAGDRILLTRESEEHGVRPSVSHLFRSLAAVYGGAATGVLLTGMGKDGADALKLMKDAGAVTIAQDRESSVVHGMPGAAIALGGATHILPAESIATALDRLVAPHSARS